MRLFWNQWYPGLSCGLGEIPITPAAQARKTGHLFAGHLDEPSRMPFGPNVRVDYTLGWIWSHVGSAFVGSNPALSLAKSSDQPIAREYIQKVRSSVRERN